MALVSASNPVQSLTAQSAITTAGSVLDNGESKASHSLFVVTSAGVSAGVVTLQGSNDNANWFSTAGTVTTSAANTTYAVAVANFPFQYVRALISTGITGGTVTATVASA